jgi:hypothetical protein
MHNLLKPILALRDFVSVVEDQWSWITRSGDFYEDVEVDKILDKEVIIQHRFGSARLLISSLSEESLKRLHRTLVWNNYILADRDHAPSFGTSREDLEAA